MSVETLDAVLRRNEERVVRAIRRALERATSQRDAARLLGIPESTLRALMRRHRVNTEVSND